MKREQVIKIFESRDEIHDAFVFSPKECGDEDLKDVPTLEELDKYRFIMAQESIDALRISYSLTLIYEVNDIYYLVTSERCSIGGYSWEPEEIITEFINRSYPKVNIKGDITKEAISPRGEGQG